MGTRRVAVDELFNMNAAGRGKTRITIDSSCHQIWHALLTEGSGRAAGRSAPGREVCGDREPAPAAAHALAARPKCLDAARAP